MLVCIVLLLTLVTLKRCVYVWNSSMELYEWQTVWMKLLCQCACHECCCVYNLSCLPAVCPVILQCLCVLSHSWHWWLWSDVCRCGWGIIVWNCTSDRECEWSYCASVSTTSVLVFTLSPARQLSVLWVCSVCVHCLALDTGDSKVMCVGVHGE